MWHAASEDAWWSVLILQQSTFPKYKRYHVSLPLPNHEPHLHQQQHHHHQIKQGLLPIASTPLVSSRTLHPRAISFNSVHWAAVVFCFSVFVFFFFYIKFVPTLPNDNLHWSKHLVIVLCGPLVIYILWQGNALRHVATRHVISIFLSASWM